MPEPATTRFVPEVNPLCTLRVALAPVTTTEPAASVFAPARTQFAPASTAMVPKLVKLVPRPLTVPADAPAARSSRLPLAPPLDRAE